MANSYKGSNGYAHAHPHFNPSASTNGDAKARAYCYARAHPHFNPSASTNGDAKARAYCYADPCTYTNAHGTGAVVTNSSSIASSNAVR